MTSSKQIHIGLSVAPTWLMNDAWRRADSDIENVFSTGFFVDIAKRAEKAKIDFLFRPDTLFMKPDMIAGSPGFSSIDPTILLTALAEHTSHIGLVTTASTTFYPPYIVARQIQSLNIVSQGRVGWNIVTSLDGNENFGISEMPSSEDRYRQAAEFTDVVHKLWASYPSDAIIADRESGTYGTPDALTQIDHHGEFYDVAGPLNTPAFGNGKVPLFQAGASPAGRDFAASVAHAIFAATPDPEVARELRSDLRQRAASKGRDPDDIRILPGLNMYLAPTREEARDIFAQTHARMDPRRMIAKIKELIALDLTDHPMDARVTADMLPAADTVVRSKTHGDLVRRLIERAQPTVKDLLTRPEVMGSSHWIVVGTPADAVDEIVAWAEINAGDGIIALPNGSHQSVDLFLDQVVPRLQELGLFRTEYSGSTLSDHLGVK
ncbi:MULTISPECIES: NtaA/DmoA family FMN-dependent monooxygenase [Thalassospira]|uniref:Monooxygenase n=2 Tax=Thalassospira TaxID=168934 RepID=A0A367W0K8_9PROT|nr:MULTISPECIES: NtaA/DmoA family FMN-dependent monooxygenase [Thalassospira]MDG4721358.1 NtaA/DmoA family FMN-dependent monooxygenase [Thalassospira sp. FZY0004]RCK32907.1 monooxygenase [Thalassospira profundimaris]